MHQVAVESWDSLLKSSPFLCLQLALVRLIYNEIEWIAGNVHSDKWEKYLVVSSGRDMQHNISYSVIRNNTGGAISYSSAGEVNPTLTVERNQFDLNGKILYGNFTTSKAAVVLDLQNTPTVYFKVLTSLTSYC